MKKKLTQIKAQWTDKHQILISWRENWEIEINQLSRIQSRETKKQEKQKVVKKCGCSSEKEKYMSNWSLKRK